MTPFVKLFFKVLFALIISISGFSQEICDNGIDDDGDGLIDINDTLDCNCGPVAIPSLIPNPSFEQTTCCPTSFSQVTCASGWSQATSPTSDYFNCGFSFPAATAAGINPPPNGTGYLGAIFSPGWQEYVGSCLSSPMIAGVSYTMEMQVASTPIDGGGGVCNGGVVNYGPIDITIFGLATCPTFPINTAGCPPGWTNLGSATYTPINSWGLVSITFTPTTNINAIILGSPCTLPPGYSNPGGCYPYFYFDNLLLNNSVLFNNVISEVGTSCGNNLQLTANNIVGATYQWYLEGVALVGETSIALNVSSNGYGFGNYTLVTTVGTACSTISNALNAPPIPVANFLVTAACFNTPNSFTDTSTIASGAITGWNWDFGDGNTSILQNPTNIYSAPGTYTTTLTVTSDVNCTNVVQQTVTVPPLPIAAFSLSNASGNGNGTSGFCLSDSVNFTDSSSISSGAITGWSWNFGDGNTSIIQNPTNVYNAPGTYQVELITTSAFACSDSVIIPLIINPLPVANFSFLNDCFYNGATFTDASSITSGTITNWFWNFGDGNTSNAQNPSNLYAAEGVYNVTLISTSDSGCLDTISYTIERFPSPVANFNVMDVCLNDSTCVQDTSTITSGTVVGWSWDFGDGSPLVNTQQPCHMFNTEGVQNIILTVVSNNSCIDDTTMSVMVNPLPMAQFLSTTVCENAPPTIFTDQSIVSSGSVTSWSWDFGDGNSSSLANPSNVYLMNGVYVVQQVITTAAGCSDSTLQNVAVLTIPSAFMASSQQAGCIDNFCVIFSDSSLSNASSITSLGWDFGNNQTGNTDSIQMCYTQEGTYDVSLVVLNDLGCSDTIINSGYIIAYPLPTADFFFTPSGDIIFDPEITFENSSIDAGSWMWGFGDNTTDSIEYFPIHVYGDTGLYSVQLDVWNQYNCHDSIIQVIYFQNEVIIEIPNVFTPNGDNQNDIFHIRSTSVVEVKAQIYNRWGMFIFEWNGIEGGWDGHSVAGKEVSEGTYYYFIQVTDIKGEVHKFNGPFNLNR